MARKNQNENFQKLYSNFSSTCFSKDYKANLKFLKIIISLKSTGFSEF